MGAYLAEHPEAMTAVNTAVTHPIPASYATLTYNSLHAFGFVNAQDGVRYGRYRLVPAQGEEDLSDDGAAGRPPDFLRDVLAQRLAQGPAVFTCGPNSPMRTTRSTTPPNNGPSIPKSSSSGVWR